MPLVILVPVILHNICFPPVCFTGADAKDVDAVSMMIVPMLTANTPITSTKHAIVNVLFFCIKGLESHYISIIGPSQLSKEEHDPRSTYHLQPWLLTAIPLVVVRFLILVS